MRLIFPVLLLIPGLSFAQDAPKVVTDIAPLHSLVSQVMAGVGAPQVLVSGAASPHDFQFTFDQASAVQTADLVIWMGPGLTPWLDDALTTLAPDTPQITLLETGGWPTLPLREWDTDHDHDHDHHGHDDGPDPHAWLDPQNAVIWTGMIADRLAVLDPDNAATYRANAATARADLSALDETIAAQLDGLQGTALLVPHDAYQYFATRYGVEAAGTITLNDAAAPSPDTIASLQAMIRDDGIQCVLSDPQSRTNWVDLVRDGSDARTALADPMGGAFAPGPDHYTQTITALADAYKDCLGG